MAGLAKSVTKAGLAGFIRPDATAKTRPCPTKTGHLATLPQPSELWGNTLYYWGKKLGNTRDGCWIQVEMKRVIRRLQKVGDVISSAFINLAKNAFASLT